MTWRAWSARLIVDERVLARRAVLDDRVGDLTQGVTDGVHPIQVAGRHARAGGGPSACLVRAFLVDEAAIGEPGQGAVEGRQLLAWETIVMVEGVQEVEGGLHADVVGVTHIGGVQCGLGWHRVTTLDHLTGYAQEANLRVTDKELLSGYRRSKKEARSGAHRHHRRPHRSPCDVRSRGPWPGRRFPRQPAGRPPPLRRTRHAAHRIPQERNNASHHLPRPRSRERNAPVTSNSTGESCSPRATGRSGRRGRAATSRTPSRS